MFDFRVHAISAPAEFTMSREIETLRRSFCRHGSRTFTEMARLAPSGLSSKSRQGIQAKGGHELDATVHCSVWEHT